MPTGLPMTIEISTNHVPAPTVPDHDAGVGEAEEEQHHVDRPLPPVLELVERVVRVGRFDEQPRIALGVRKKRDDRHQRERRMQPSAIEPDPRQHAAAPECTARS